MIRKVMEMMLIFTVAMFGMIGSMLMKQAHSGWPQKKEDQQYRYAWLPEVS